MKSQIKFPVIVYTSWYLLILFYQIFLQPFYKLTNESLTLYQRLYLSWIIYWDSGHYVTIAKDGYHFPQQAFFPLWPLLIKIFSYIFGFYNASFILSFVIGLSTFVLFYILGKKLVGEKGAKFALILFSSFPSTFFLHAGYTEGLFLSLTLLSFLMWEKKLYLASAIFASLTTVTRLSGIAITAGYMFLKQPLSKKLTLIFISLLGLIFYVIFLQLKFGNGLLFIDAQKAWCGSQGRCQFIFPLTPLISYGGLLIKGWVKPNLSTPFLDWFSSVLFLGMLISVFRKFKLPYFTYSLTVVLLPLFSSTVGMVRYVLVAFPIFFVFPQIVKSKFLFFIICFLLFLLQLRFIALFTNRLWVA